jgi:hypothetical protein
VLSAIEIIPFIVQPCKCNMSETVLNGSWVCIFFFSLVPDHSLWSCVWAFLKESVACVSVLDYGCVWYCICTVFKSVFFQCLGLKGIILMLCWSSGPLFFPHSNYLKIIHRGFSVLDIYAQFLLNITWTIEVFLLCSLMLHLGYVMKTWGLGLLV